MRITAVITGEYGRRHAGNIIKYKPNNWSVNIWEAQTVYPLVIDYPEDYLPESMPAADLLLSFGEHKAVAELIPEIAEMSGAKSVIAPVDNEAWLPRGLARQLQNWLEHQSVFCVTPKPLCSLTPTSYLVSRYKRIEYQDDLISEFAGYFGQPEIDLDIDPLLKSVRSFTVKRDAVCGCARFVAEGLINQSVEDAEEKAGLLHHHFPCLASMGKDVDFGDTLMHVSGNLLKDNIRENVKPFKNIGYISPGNLSD